MMHKAWCSIVEVPYYLSRSCIKFQGHAGWKIDDLNPRVKLNKITRPVVAIKYLRFALLWTVFYFNEMKWFQHLCCLIERVCFDLRYHIFTYVLKDYGRDQFVSGLLWFMHYTMYKEAELFIHILRNILLTSITCMIHTYPFIMMINAVFIYYRFYIYHRNRLNKLQSVSWQCITFLHWAPRLNMNQI